MIDGKPIITLPPKSVILLKVDFSVEERDFYTQLESASRSQFKVSTVLVEPGYGVTECGTNMF